MRGAGFVGGRGKVVVVRRERANFLHRRRGTLRRGKRDLEHKAAMQDRMLRSERVED
jgi:hypothetical protein